jgi:hypothetical protein
MLDVSIRTIYLWRATKPEFAVALKVGKSEADERVERSLYNRAIGYTFNSEKVFQFQGQIVRTPTIEHVPPDTVAMIFWLKNRRPEQWREKNETVITHRRANELTDDELADIASRSSDRASAKANDPSKLH